MRILVTCPGKFGDLIWSMSVARAIAETYGETVDVMTSKTYGSIAPLLQHQPYITTAIVDQYWAVRDTAPMTPRVSPGHILADYDRLFHLGYDGWPQHPLPLEHWRLAVQQREWFPNDPPLKDLELGRPWITSKPWGEWEGQVRVAVGFTDEHFELKVGLYTLLEKANWALAFVGASPRWRMELGEQESSWENAARIIRAADVFLGCNSALHVLAVALGTPVVMMEPNPHRHQAIFFPLDTAGPQVTLVTGTDGLPTFDARHVAEALTAVLEQARV
jgi:hypothetical protein